MNVSANNRVIPEVFTMEDYAALAGALRMAQQLIGKRRSSEKSAKKWKRLKKAQDQIEITMVVLEEDMDLMMRDGRSKHYYSVSGFATYEDRAEMDIAMAEYRLEKAKQEAVANHA